MMILDSGLLFGPPCTCYEYIFYCRCVIYSLSVNASSLCDRRLLANTLIFIVPSSMAKPYARVRTGHLNESRSTPSSELDLWVRLLLAIRHPSPVRE